MGRAQGAAWGAVLAGWAGGQLGGKAKRRARCEHIGRGLVGRGEMTIVESGG